MENLAKAQPNYFKRVSKEWLEQVHGSKKNDTLHVYDAYKGMIDGGMYTTYDDEILQKLTWDNVVGPDRDYRGPSFEERRESGEMFLGPMACTMGRADLTKLAEKDYWITEKSDGIRAMMLSLFVGSFPRWEREFSGELLTLNLHDNCVIETTFQHFQRKIISSLNQKEKISIKLDIGTFDYFVKDNILKNENEVIKLTRSKGWTFSYLFDRTAEYFLCIEEFVFPTRHSMKNRDKFSKQWIVLFDGEIVHNIPENRYNYSIYDLVSYCDVCSTNQVRVYSTIRIATTKKIQLIRGSCTEPYYFYYKAYKKHTPLPKSLNIIPKHFYTKSELPHLYSLIKKDPKTGEYTYKGYNKNDGIVFTPERYQYKPSTSYDMLKWKWPDKLTVDFRVIASNNQPNNEFLKVGLYYGCRHDKELFTCHYRDVDLKTADLEESVINSLTVPGGVIAEMGFDVNSKSWGVHLIRDDKQSPNAFRTIISTLLNAIENITIDDIIGAFENTLKEPNYGPKDRNMAFKFNQANAYVSLQVRRVRSGLIFETCHIHNQEEHWKKIASSSEVMGPDGQTGDHLNHYVNSKLNDGCKYCNLMFMPRFGKWRIHSMQVYGGTEQSNLYTFPKMLEQLEKILILVYKKKS